MKAIYKVVAVGMIGALVMATMPATARAEHRRNNDAAVAVIAGVAAVGIIAAIASSHHADVHVAYDDCAPPPRWEPPARFIPGHWEIVVEPAEYGWVRHGYRTESVVVRPEIHRQVWVAGHYDDGRYAYAR